MFIYEQNNALNVVFKGNRPVETPDFVIKGYKNGAAVLVNGTEVISVVDAVELDTVRSPIVFQKNDVLNVTYQGIEGMKNPEVTINEVSKNVVEITSNGETITLEFDETGVVTSTESTPEEEPDTEGTPDTETDGPTFDLPEFTEEEEE